jgi:DNA polymerase family B
MSKTFQVGNVNDLELLYSVLRQEYPKQHIEVCFDYSTKRYSIEVSKKPFNGDPKVPVDVNIQVVYGDSVTGDTPLVLRDPATKNVFIKTIDSLTNEWQEYPGFKMFGQDIRLEKQFGTTHYEVWCDQGWTPIKKVIRHKTDKKIFRVLTHTGVVDVTEDHSLCTPNLEKIKPCELKIGDHLLHSFPTEFHENEVAMVKLPKTTVGETKTCTTCNETKDISMFYKNIATMSGYVNRCKECSYYKTSSHPLRNNRKNFDLSDYPLTPDEARVWGFFLGDGSCGRYECASGVKRSWALNNAAYSRLEKYKSILEKVEPMEFKILDTLKSSGVYKLVPVGSIAYMVDKYRPLFYDLVDATTAGDKLKIVPNCILNASLEIRQAFWEGYWDADGAKTGMYSVDKPSFACKGKIGSQGLYYLMRSLGFDIGIYASNQINKQKYYHLRYTNFRNKQETVVKKIFELKGAQDKFVYDLETECGRFQVGVGQMVGFNTDSCFLRFKYNRDDKRANRVDTFKLATLCGDKLTDEVFARPPIVLEFEKVFQPFILLTKKRYIAKKYENIKDPFALKGVDAKGIALTRRDYCKMVKNCYKEMIDAIMDDSGQYTSPVKESTSIFKRYISNIEKYDVPIDELVVSAALAANYKSDNLPHVNLARKLKERKEEVSVGDRVPYIFIESDDPKQKKYELAEDPKYAQQNNLKFNRLCYLEQLAKPILSLLKIILVEHETELDAIIDHVNDKIVKFGGKKLKPSDFKMED